jgi:hypothetical protein
MYHIQGGDPKTNPKAEEAWQKIVDKFKELFSSEIEAPFDYIFTADVRIRDYMKSIGYLTRTLSRTFKHSGERESLTGGKTPV